MQPASSQTVTRRGGISVFSGHIRTQKEILSLASFLSKLF